MKIARIQENTTREREKERKELFCFLRLLFGSFVCLCIVEMKHFNVCVNVSFYQRTEKKEWFDEQRKKKNAEQEINKRNRDRERYF